MKKSEFRFQPGLRLESYNVAKAPKLYVKSVLFREVITNWIPHHPDQSSNLKASDIYYVECQQNGFVNWKTAKLYTPTQLVGRDNVHVVSKRDKVSHTN